MASLSILGAAYGLSDVTETVRDQVQNDSLSLAANNNTFGDTWPSQRKSLVIVYQYDNQPPQVLAVAENGTATITDSHQTVPWSPPSFDQLTVLGAAYGLQNVTGTLQGLVSSNALDIAAENGTFGDGWPNVLKTLVVVYQIHGLTLTRIVQEHSRLATLPLTILGATWGPQDVTAQVAAHVDVFQELHIPAGNNIVFDDTWFGHHKSLVVVYQYGNEQPQTAITEEGSWLTITYAPQPAFQPSNNPAVLQVLGAAYGLENVTNTASGMIRGDRLFTSVDDTSLGQQGGWPEPDLKTLTVVYQYGAGTAEVACNQQNTTLQIVPSENYALQLTNNASVACTPPSFGTGDLTMEAWIQTTQPGPLCTIQRTSNGPPPYESLALGVDSGGYLNFLLAMFDRSSGRRLGVNSFRSVRATPLLDGEWHHVAVVRSGANLLAYVDGEALQNQQPTAAGVADLGNAEALHIGSALPSPLALAPDIGQAFTGLIDEVRLWTVALSQAAIEDGMHHQLTDQEQGLGAHWTFDDQSLQDSSPAGRTLSPSGAVLYAPSAIDIEPEGSPYIITQAQLMEDFLPDPDPQNQGQFKPINGYRVQVTARDAAGNPIPTNITIWAADSDYPAQVHFFDGFNAAVTDQTSTARVTNAHGEISFVIDSAAGGNALVCPPIKIHASFMAPQERLVISPDRHVHATLAGITADQLAGRSPLPSGKTVALAGTSTQTTQQLAVSATAISQVMSAAIEHTLQPERPLVRKRDAPIDLPVPEPYAAGYEDVFTFVTPYDFQSNAQATHFLPTDQSVTRILVPENMDAPHWHFDWSNAQFTPISLDQRQQLVGALSVTHLDAFTQQFNNSAAVGLSSQQLLSIAQAQDTPAARQKRWFGSSFLSEVASATQIVLTTVESTLEDVEETVATVVVTVINAAGQAFDAALQTVEDAVNFAVAVFQKIGAAVVDVVNFVKALFEWDDILLTQQAIGAVLQQVPAWIKSSLTSMEASIDGWLADLESTFDAQFDTWIHAVAGHTYNSQTATAKNSPPQNLQSKYVTTLYADNLASTHDEQNTLSVDPQVAQQTGDTWRTGFPQSNVSTLQPTLQDPDIWSFFSNPEALLGGLLEDLLALLKQAVRTGIDLVKSGIHTVFSLAQSAIDEVYALCTTRIVIPYVTTFYENVVLASSAASSGVLGELNLLSLVSLAAAIPATVVYKLVSGTDHPPFSAADIAQLQNPQWAGYTAAQGWMAPLFGGTSATSGEIKRSSATAGDAPVGPWEITTWVMGYTYAVATALWGVACFIEDSPQLSVATWTRTVSGCKCATQFLTLVSGFPVFGAQVKDDAPQPFPRSTLIPLAIIYWGGAVAFFSNFVCFTDLMGTPARQQSTKWYRDIADPLLTGIYGCSQIVCYAVMIGFQAGSQSPWMTILSVENALGEAFEWIPQLGKIVGELSLASPPVAETAKLLVPLVEGGAYAIAAGTAAGLTTMKLTSRLLK